MASCLDDPDFHVRMAACETLAQFGPAAASTIPRLLAFARDASDPAFRFALEALGSVGAESPSMVLPVVVAGLRSDDGWTRLYALRAVKNMGASAESILPIVLDALDDDWIDPAANVGDVNANDAAEALGAIGPAAVPPLLARLESEGEACSRHVLHAIATLGKHGAAATTILREMLDNKTAQLRPLWPKQPTWPPIWIQSLPFVKSIVRARFQRYYDRCGPLRKDQLQWNRIARALEATSAVRPTWEFGE